MFEPHSLKQDEAIFSRSKITALVCGIQFGKTTVGAVWMKHLMCEFTGSDDAFIVTAPTYKILEQSTMPAFKKLMEGYGDFNQQKATFSMYNGGTCYFRTNTEPDSIVGITNVRGIWGDEAGKYTLYFWENIQGRASFKQCPILLTTSPYTLNWLYKDVVRPYKQKKRQDITLIEARSNENPYFPQEEYERRRKTMDPRRFEAMYGGKFEKMSGLVYDCFDDSDNTVIPFELPAGTKYYAGVDWGYTDPFVLVVRAVTPSGNHFQISEFYKTGMTLSDMIMLARQKKQNFNIQTFYCDPSQPGHIEEFNRHGLSAIGADNDIRRGIDLHYELIKTRRYKIFQGAGPYTIDEMETYHYAEPKDLKPDQDGKEAMPVGQGDHCMDANRYVTISTYRANLVHTPRVPGDVPTQEDHEQRLKRLKKKKPNWKRQTEEYGNL